MCVHRLRLPEGEPYLEIILDVIENEGNCNGPVYSFKGIDNSTYYLMTDRTCDPYENFSGTGNSLHCENHYVRKVILDSLRHWVNEMHVDGFRFDLACIFTRKNDGSIDLDNPLIFGDIIADPHLAGIRLIAEPWDAAGPTENYSWNCGWEGDASVPTAVANLRKRQIKKFCCMLFLANGTPQLRAGDDFGQTQQANTNPYNQDNETSWLNWDRLTNNPDIFRFFQKMITFRKAHRSLGRSRFWREDVSWYGIGSAVDLSRNSDSLAHCLRGASQQDADIYVMVNAYWEDLKFTIQEGQFGE